MTETRTETSLTLYLIRHGLTYQNLCREYQGSILNYDILPQSRELIESRQRRGASPFIRTLWASPLVRARRTAELYFPGMDMEYHDDLMEREFGDWDGRTHEDLLEDEDYQSFLRSFGRATPPGGESYENFKARMDRVLGKIEALALESPQSFPLALVFHGGPILHLTDLLLDEDHPHYRYYSQGAGGLEVRFRLQPFQILEVKELFTDDIPVEKTPFYLEFNREKALRSRW